jgi:hypothetical protein
MAITRDNPEMQCSMGWGEKKKNHTPPLKKKFIFISLQRYFLSVNNVQRTDPDRHTHTHDRSLAALGLELNLVKTKKEKKAGAVSNGGRQRALA